MRTGKWTAAILAMLLLLPTFAACENGDDTPDDTSAKITDTSAPVHSQEDTTADTTPVETEATLAFEQEDNQNRTFTIFTGTEDVYLEYLDEEKSDRVSLALADRNRNVEEYLGIKLNIVHESCNAERGAIHNKNILSSIQSGDGAYDYVTGWISRVVPIAGAANFYNFLEMPYLDLDNPWWVQGLEEGAAINGKLYLLDGDVCLSMYSGLSVVFINKDLIEAKHLEDPYTLVNDGTWTLDKFLTITAGAGEDLNGDGIWEEGTDMFGMLCEGNAWRAMNCALDVHSVTIEDGVPVVHEPDERLINASDKIFNYFNTNSDVRYGPATHDGMGINEMFAANQAVFLVHKLGNMTSLGDMEADFGIIPLPKYDEEQTDYYTCVAGASQIIMVPVNVSDPALTGKALEALSYFSWRDVVPAYYEQSLQERYSRDPETAHMLDLIRGGALNSVDVLFATTIGDGNSILWPNFTVVGDSAQYGKGGSNNIVSLFKKVSGLWEKNISKLLENYTDSE